MPLPRILPPLINSASPWASDEADLEALFACPHTGAVTTRTSLLNGFAHDNAIHQYTFIRADHSVAKKVDLEHIGSLNTLGYSPYTLSQYLEWISKHANKTCIISVTGTVDEVSECYERINKAQKDSEHRFCMEINLSCPNIPGKPPPAYSGEAVSAYLKAIKIKDVPLGLKVPPYTHHDQFVTLVSALNSTVDFITATNTLGSCLVLANGEPALQSTTGGIGGMAGAPLHALSLGNVKTLRNLLDEAGLYSIDIIGVGGVSDKAGYERMKIVGAKVVGLATALGQQGVQVFERIVAEQTMRS